ncbi:MAG: aromatic hydrocarbon degradation protein [Niabella sp.]
MKKILLAATILTAYNGLHAQTKEDALRYSFLQNSGTARSQGIANANGAIGGEISTIFSNPANIGFYKTGDFVISGGLNLLSNDAAYLGASNKENKTSGFLGTTGFVLGKPNYNDGSSLKSSAFGIAVNRVADFNNRVVYNNKGGQLSRTSMADYFIEDIIASNSLYAYGSELAVNSGWVQETVNGDTVNLSSSAVDLAIASGLEQQETIITNGGITELAFAGAANFNDRVFLGGTIGLPILRYGASRRYVEQDPDASDNTNGFDAAWYDDDLVTKGVGINLKVGIVFKATDNLRLGFAAHSPTFYSLTDSYSAAAGSNLDAGANGDYTAYSDVSTYDYNLQTPYKLMGSFSLLFGNVNDISTQKGFLSGDVEYVNYMASTFRTIENSDNDNNANNEYFGYVNNDIDDAYKGAVNARLGAELKFNPISVRLGGAYYGNPYKSGDNGSVTQATGGLGYRNKGFFIDLGYVHSFSKEYTIYPYQVTPTADDPTYVSNPAKIKPSASRVVFTLGFKI